jgi:hypothetical protein
MQRTSVDYGDYMLKESGHHYYEKVKGYHGLTGFCRSEILEFSGCFTSVSFGGPEFCTAPSSISCSLELQSQWIFS